MNTTSHKYDPGIKRILIALNAPLDNLEVIKNSVKIATRLRAEMAGLFIEDINLLRLAALPLAYEVSYGSRACRCLDSASMERSLESQAKATREKLSAAAGQVKIPWSFQVKRGHVIDEVLGSVLSADLLILGNIEEALVSSANRVTITQQILLQSSCTVLVQRYKVNQWRPVVVYFDDSALSQRALILGAQLARAGSHALAIILPPLIEEQNRKLQQEIERQLQALEMPYQLHRLPDESDSSLMKALAMLHGTVFITCNQSMLEDESDLQKFLEKIKCNYVLVR